VSHTNSHEAAPAQHKLNDDEHDMPGHRFGDSGCVQGVCGSLRKGAVKAPHLNN